MHFNTGGHCIFVNVKTWIVMGYVAALFFVSRPKEHKYPRHPCAELGKILTGNGLIVDEALFIAKHFFGGVPGDLDHFIMVDQRNVFMNDVDFTGAAMGFANLFYDSYKSFGGLLFTVGAAGIKKSDRALQTGPCRG